MRYIANSSGYLLQVSFGATIQCNGKTCTAYTGGVPEGYDSLADWFSQEAEKLYRWKIVNGELTLDSSAAAPSSTYAGYVKRTGDSMQGSLSIVSSDNYPRLNLRDANGNDVSRMQVNAETHQLGLYQYCPDKAGKREGYHLPPPDNRTESIDYRILTTKTHRMVKLWQNASPDSSFGAQTKALGLSGYDAVSIFYRNASDSTTYLSTGLIPIGYKINLSYVTTNGTVYSRPATVNTDGIVFENGASGSTSGAKYGIPIIIYGIKGLT